MALEDDIATLSRAPLFHLLDRDALRLLAFAADSRHLEAGAVLFHKGEPSDGGYVVSRGSIALGGDEDGPVPFVAAPGALIGQAALFTTIERPATATATERSIVLHIAPGVMRRMLQEFPDSAAAMQATMAEELAGLTDGLESVRRQLLAIDQNRA